MTSSVFGSWKIDWTKVMVVAVVVFVATLMINCIITGVSEGNGMLWFGFLSVAFGIWFCVDSSWDQEIGQFGRYAISAAFFLFFLVSPLLHVADADKVWIVGDKTTLGSSVLLRLPFAPLAASVKKKQDVNFAFTAPTKEGTPVRGSVSGAFRLTDDDRELASSFAGIEDPDKAARLALQGVLGRAFGDAISRRSVADIASLPNTFTLEVDVGTATVVRQLGLRRNGEFTVYGLRPYFIDR